MNFDFDKEEWEYSYTMLLVVPDKLYTLKECIDRVKKRYKSADMPLDRDEVCICRYESVSDLGRWTYYKTNDRLTFKTAERIVKLSEL